jgi:hypothetical protein
MLPTFLLPSSPAHVLAQLVPQTHLLLSGLLQVLCEPISRVVVLDGLERGSKGEKY